MSTKTQVLMDRVRRTVATSEKRVLVAAEIVKQAAAEADENLDTLFEGKTDEEIDEALLEVADAMGLTGDEVEFEDEEDEDLEHVSMFKMAQENPRELIKLANDQEALGRFSARVMSASLAGMEKDASTFSRTGGEDMALEDIVEYVEEAFEKRAGVLSKRNQLMGLLRQSGMSNSKILAASEKTRPEVVDMVRGFRKNRWLKDAFSGGNRMTAKVRDNALAKRARP